MVKLDFHIVDVFATRQYSGNQLAVFWNTGALSTDEMQAIAREVNYSETTFVLSDQPRNGGYDTRIFTPRCELPFAGHPVLGTAFVLQMQQPQLAEVPILLNLPVGVIPVRKKHDPEFGDLFWMQQNPAIFQAELPATTLASVLSLTLDDLDLRVPIQEVSTGLPFIIVPLKTRAALQAARLNRDAYSALIAQTEAQSILIFAPEAYTTVSDLSVRVFAEAVGIAEDPATGSANGCLAAYLARHRYFGTTSVDVRVEQGYEIERPSQLWLKAREQAAERQVAVGGRVLPVARGEFF
ncbi:MAG: PhzF family phenazine biosynthesis protein [Spirulinaceae cyanobacterium SM2_1_0]|nr:PhzF family phenazine biosynthesis protein [Spirulinaceae cyanobacterium SM2_1_0]